MQRTKIEWCNFTWNPVTGCLHGCSYCFAKPLYKRFGWSFMPTLHYDRLQEPLRMKKPAVIFLGSVSDLFGNWGWWDGETELYPQDVISGILGIVKQCPQHIFISLTKNPRGAQGIDFPPNWWIGTSIENQAAANKRVPELLKVNAHLLLSIEPMHGPVNLTGIEVPREHDQLNPTGYFPSEFNCLTTHYDDVHYRQPAAIEWVIVGEQTGPEKVSVQQPWIISILDQCEDHDIPTFVKNNTGFPGVQEWPEPMEEIIRVRRERRC